MARLGIRFLLLSSVALSACATRGDAPPRPVFEAVAPEAPEQWAASGVVGTAPSGDWIRAFGDPALDSIVTEALGNNPTLDARAALLRASEALTRVARAGKRPVVSASATVGATSTGVDVLGSVDRINRETYGLGLDASWEPDFWGRIGASVREAEADYQASAADLAAAELSVAAQTVLAWIELATAVQQKRLADDDFQARDRVRALTERRVASGVSDALDVRTARSALAGAEANIAASEQAIGEAARRLEILAGRYPLAEIEAGKALPALGALSVEGSPPLLLARRPDIAAAEARVTAAGLRAEQARLAMLPSLRLSGGLDSSQLTLEDALDPQLIAARLIASLVQPLYTGGRLDAQRDAAVAQAEAAIANYASLTLSAWGEVEDAIAADAYIARQEDAQLRALEEARQAEALAERQYVSGTITIFNLIDAQSRRINAEGSVISARARRASNRVVYHLALGGAGVTPTVDAPLQ